MATAQVQTLAAEQHTLEHGCGLFDRSERGKLALTGAGAVEFLGGQVTNDVGALRAGDGCYAAFLTHKGKMLGDLRILARGEDPEAPPTELLLDTERVALQSLFDMIRRFKVGYQVELHKRTVELAMISLIGPRADAVADVPGLAAAEHASAEVRIGAIAALAVRTDVGVDLICAAPDAAQMTAAAIERGAVVVEQRAVECLRVERGRPRFGVDLDESVIPQEAGLNERAVSFTKGCYVGQETVARLHYRGKPNRHLRGLALGEPAHPGEEIRHGERPVGHTASCAVSPRLGPIALALVRREAEPGSTVLVGDAGTPATVVELPFARP